jgi:hypothetical protein
MPPERDGDVELSPILGIAVKEIDIGDICAEVIARSRSERPV